MTFEGYLRVTKRKVLGAAAFGLGLTGCATSIGTVPNVALGDAPAFKMIKPDAHDGSCQLTWLWSNPMTADAMLAPVFAELRAVDPEIDTLQNMRIGVSAWTLGLVRRDCVSVTADLGRSIPTVSVPMDHAHHHHD